MRIKFAFLFAILCLVAVPVQATMWIMGEDLLRGERDLNDFIVRAEGQITVLGYGGWQSMPATFNGDGSPYFDTSTTWDYPGYGRNPGYFMTGTGAWTGDSRSPAWPSELTQFWAFGDGNPVPNVAFWSDQMVTMTLISELGSAFAPWNQWLWTDMQGNAHLIFAGSDTEGATASFNPGGQFGLLLRSPMGDFYTQCNGGQFFTARTFNPPPPPPGEVPEPASMIFMGTGLVGLALIRKLRT